MVQKIAAEDLRRVPAFSDLPEDERQWIVENGTLRELAEGEFLFRKGDAADEMWVILEGKIQMVIDQNGQQIPVNSYTPGHISGVLPYSRMKTTQSSAYALSPTLILTVHRNQFPLMVRLCPELVRHLVETMTSRVRDFTRLQEQREKLQSLSKLSAGLAHELNNPASAIVRSSAELRKRMNRFPERVQQLIQQEISPGQLSAIKTLLEARIRQELPRISAIERSEREDELADWLEDRQVDESFCYAETFVKAGITTRDLEEITVQLPEKALPGVVAWMDSMLTAQYLLVEIEQAAGRISQLIDTVKTYTHMDQANDQHWVDPLDGIYHTLAMLNYKLQEKNIKVNLDFEPDTNKIQGYISELNQLWTNLIDNAIDAMNDGGELTISAIREGSFLQVQVRDNGMGIPEEIQNKIFDPFFTTKPLGKGVGLGLDVANRVVMNHNGTIRVNSVPGQTVFTVSFPLNLTG